MSSCYFRCASASGESVTGGGGSSGCTGSEPWRLVRRGQNWGVGEEEIYQRGFGVRGTDSLVENGVHWERGRGCRRCGRIWSDAHRGTEGRI
uniref:Uncharacterized protein n=1 Tax=Arundo donax TaxID=35708 RepID=A0A0A8YLF0_ARUDO